MDKAEKEMFEGELKSLKTIEDIAHLEGVQTLTNDLKAIIVTTVGSLASGYFDKTEVELRALCATLLANLTLYQKITGVSEQIHAIEKAMVPE